MKPEELVPGEMFLVQITDYVHIAVRSDGYQAFSIKSGNWVVYLGKDTGEDGTYIHWKFLVAPGKTISVLNSSITRFCYVIRKHQQ